MFETNIKFDVVCDNYEPNIKIPDPIYRIFINNDLITERTWIWDKATKITEDIWCIMVPFTEYVIKLVPISKQYEPKQFTINNLAIAPPYSSSQYVVDQNTISFKLQ